ncbi:glycoside hydrolase family protein [Rhizobacter sp. OV335]|uniref:glycoside hydrolase family protein n=1 Tax=Rhizobacter sp. OV335 TaxID=1500264 RepID=UPI000911221C|nr:glycoside hydrolase family protein [Rhizobacter sp. OV335]SHN39985.1 lysozyme [Rhizobacter sp. OV335]
MIDELTVQLRRDEDEVLHEYKDSLGYSTIGVGRLIDKRKGGGITREESAYLLRNDIEKVRRQLQERAPWTAALSEPRLGVLLNMAFQMGIDGLMAFENTLVMIEQREWEKAAKAMLQSKWAGQTPERARRLAEQMRTDAWQ